MVARRRGNSSRRRTYYQAGGGVPTVLGGIADRSRFRRPPRGGRTTGCAASDGRATGRATRASDRRQGARDRLATRLGWRAAPDRRRPLVAGRVVWSGARYVTVP
eukprot:363764-Chlamydomonas_euryale.AAC.8